MEIHVVTHSLNFKILFPLLLTSLKKVLEGERE